MAARDGASSILGTWLRVTPLTVAGDIDTSKPVLNSKGFISATFSPQFEEGDEITEKAADGSVCVSFKVDDSFTRVDFSLSLCDVDPEVTALLAGGNVILDGDGAVIGYSSPVAGAKVGNPVAIEIWSQAVVAGKPASDRPYWHWAFPYVKVRYEGDREIGNSRLANEFTGQGVGNSALVSAGLNPANAGDDYVTYREALINPFSYVRTTGQPDTQPLFSGSWPDVAGNILPYSAPTGVTDGTPGAFTPSTATVPYDLGDLQALGALGESTAWTTGQYVVLGDGSTAHWDGAAWANGEA
jgi:hypothetical protein